MCMVFDVRKMRKRLYDLGLVEVFWPFSSGDGQGSFFLVLICLAELITFKCRCLGLKT